MSEVKKLDLKYTPRSVHEVEQALGASLLQSIGRFDVKSLGVLVQKGLGLKDLNDGFDKMQAYIESGGDTIQLQMDIMESLQASGFLPRTLDMKEIRSKMESELINAV